MNYNESRMMVSYFSLILILLRIYTKFVFETTTIFPNSFSMCKLLQNFMCLSIQRRLNSQPQIEITLAPIRCRLINPVGKSVPSCDCFGAVL